MNTANERLLLCPKCGGQGHVAKPPWVPGDQHEWLSSTTGGHVCTVCRGVGYLTAASAAARAGSAAPPSGRGHGKAPRPLHGYVPGGERKG